MPEDASVKAMLLGAATQMNSQLLYDYSKNLEDERVEKIVPNEPDEEPIAEQEAKEETLKNLTKVGEHEEKFIGGEEKSMEYFGFVKGGDIAKTKIPEITTQELPNEVIKENIEEIPNQVKDEEEKNISTPVNTALVANRIKLFIPKFFGIFKKIKFNKEFFSFLKTGNKLLLIIPAFLVVLALGILYVYLFKMSVQATVLVNSKQEQKELEVTFSSSTNADEKTLAFDSIQVLEDGTVSTNSTGKKDVGEKGKGTVTIFNNSDSTVNFSSGTKITSANNLEFTTDKAVLVASASGDIFSGTKPGTTSVGVTASEIGQEYNLPSGTKFTIGSNSDLAAKNDNAFSGGTKKSVTVVSVDDLDKLLIDLPKSLEQKARDDLKSKNTRGKTIIQQFASKNVDSKSFSKKEGDQASSVSLKGTVSFIAISYLNSDMEDLANSLFSTNEKFIPQSLNVEAANIKTLKNKDITADLTIKAGILPKVDVEALRKEIAGSSLLKAKNILMSIPQAVNAEISFNPNIPFLPKNLPGDYKKIFINVTSK